jgi:hypothetical protein
MNLFTKNLRTLLSTKTRVSEKGQSLAEMVISMTILVMLMSGLIDIGRAYFTYIALEDAAGEAALYLSTNVTCPFDGLAADGITPTADDGKTGVGTDYDQIPAYTLNATTYYDNGKCNPPNNAVWRAVNSGGTGGLVNWSDSKRVSWTMVCVNNEDGTVRTTCATADSDDIVTVSITYKFGLISPLIPNITGSPTINLTGTSTQTIVSVKR